jgi:hypothetical protein
VIDVWDKNTHEGNKKCMQNVGEEPEWTRPFLRPGCRWEDNIKIDLKDALYDVS